MCNPFLRFAPLLCCTPLIVGCGSGNGSERTIPFSTNSEIPENGTVEIPGEARTASYVVDNATGEIFISNLTGPVPSRVLITREDGEEFLLRLIAPSSRAEFNTRTGAEAILSGFVILYGSDGGDNFAQVVNGTSAPLEHQVFGTWATGLRDGRGSLSAGSFGNVTPVDSVPSGVTASYGGISTGLAKLSDGVGYETLSNVSLFTDFSTFSMSSENTEAFRLSDGQFRDAAELDFSGNGSVSGAGFSAIISASPTMSGEVQGVFYGPGAEEVGGTFEMSGPDDQAYIGSFGLIAR